MRPGRAAPYSGHAADLVFARFVPLGNPPVPVSRSVLLVDDDPTFLRHIERFISKEIPSLQVVGSVSNAGDGVAQAGELQPDVILLDLSMPGTDGFEAIPLLRDAAPDAVIVAVTMMEEDEYRDRVLDLGADGFVPKSRLVTDLRSELDRLRPAQTGDADAQETKDKEAATTADVEPHQPPAHTLFDADPTGRLDPAFPPRAGMGVPGLDSILCGGVPRQETYLVQGGPGTGKTTLGLQFLRAGAERGEPGLFVTLRRSLETIARSHGWDLEGVEIREYGDAETSGQVQTVFPSSEVELEETVELIREAVRDVAPGRVVVDTISDLRELSGDHARYRRELRELRQFLAAQGCTVLFLDDTPENTGDRELQNQANGVFALRQKSPEYGGVRRSMQVIKMRSTPFLTGSHNFRIRTGGMEVYPRITADGENSYDTWDPVPSGIPALDEMLGGGLREGTACLVAGPTGSGKSAVAFQYAHAAAERGESASVFLFNERLETFYMRSQGLGMDMKPHVEAGRLHVEQVDTGVIAPSEFAQRVRRTVETDGAKVVVIDSLSGYVNAMLRQSLLLSQMHELITYLSQKGVLTLLVVDQHGPFSTGEQASPGHVSYLADSVLLLAYQKETGHRQRSISVLKQRHGPHALDARRLQLSERGIAIGEPVYGFEGLTLDPPVFATFYPSGGDSDGRIAVPAPPA